VKIVKTGDISRIFGDDLKTFGQLPSGNYKVCFDKMMGFYLLDTDSFKVEEKQYGQHPLKIAKVEKLFDSIDRSVGIILSGEKGMGKSMFARALSASFAEDREHRNIPTVIVNYAFPGVVDFLESIKQECIVLFDEFEKVFDNGEQKEPQDRLLSLFDGVSQTKRLYVVTVNDIRRVNQYMINRPGRFHYHLQFSYPSHEEIAEYLKDKLLPEYYDQIGIVQRFSSRASMNYDALRAIAHELNQGYTFKETIEDLNVSTPESDMSVYSVNIEYSNGTIAGTELHLNLMGSRCRFSHDTPTGDYVTINFSPLDVVILDKSSFTVTAGEVEFTVDYDEDNKVLTDESKIFVERMVFTKRGGGKTRYGKEVEQFLA
jgi:hypothetical protein